MHRDAARFAVVSHRVEIAREVMLVFVGLLGWMAIGMPLSAIWNRLVVRAPEVG